jgi:23S rRNA (uracil1939-C5)-methyltransferase
VVDTLLEPGPQRTDPVCAVFGSCGGCAWQHVRYEAQLAAKRALATAALERIGGLKLPQPLAITPSPSPYGYRSRSRVLVQAGKLGYRRRRSNALCPTRRCPVLAIELDARLSELADDPPVDGEWELVSGRDDHTSELRVRTASAVESGPRLWLSVDRDRVGFSPGVFVQSNAGLIEVMTRAVVEAAGTGRLLLELFAGAGFLTLGLSRRFEAVVAVEGNPKAVADLEINLRDARIENARVVLETAEACFASASLTELRPDVVVLDPPRTGLPGGVGDAIADRGPDRIVYLSCDPATLSRDLSLLDHRGYSLTHAEAFDLFPQTPHVEVLAVCKRRVEV